MFLIPPSTWSFTWIPNIYSLKQLKILYGLQLHYDVAYVTVHSCIHFTHINF